MLRIAFTILAAATLAACAAPATSESIFNELAMQVEDEIRKAETVGFLWRDTDVYLQQARQARQQGEQELAVKLAQQALRQARLAVQQAKDNIDPPTSFPNN